MFVDGFGQSEERLEDEALGEPSLESHRAAMVRAMPEVGTVIDRAEVGKGKVVLRRRVSCRPQGRVIGPIVHRKHIDVPILYQAHAGRALVQKLQNITGA